MAWSLPKPASPSTSTGTKLHDHIKSASSSWPGYGSSQGLRTISFPFLHGWPLLSRGSQVTCRSVRKIFPTQRSHLPHHSVAFSWFSLSMAFITNGTQLGFFFFQFAYLDIICLLAGISAPRGQGSVLALLSPQPGLVTITWLVPNKCQTVEWMCQLELWRNQGPDPQNSLPETLPLQPCQSGYTSKRSESRYSKRCPHSHVQFSR